MRAFFAIIICIEFLLVFYSSVLSSKISSFQVADEIFLITLVVSILFINRKENLRRAPKIIFPVIMFALYASLQSLFSKYYQGFFLSTLDIILALKPFVVFFCIASLDRALLRSFIKFLFYHSIFFIFIASLFYVINLSFPLFEARTQRFGLPAYRFIFNNSGELGNLIFFSGMFILVFKVKGLPSFLRTVLVLGLLVLTTRFKAIVSAALYVVATVFRSYISGIENADNGDLVSRRWRVKWLPVLALLPLGLSLGYSQFSLYFLSEDVTPRLFLLINGFNLMVESFPFGTGAGTYGSAVSKIAYSQVYYDLGFHELYGLNPDEPLFLTDNFWPMVLAQYGFLGFILYSFLFYRVIKFIFSTGFKSPRYLVVVLMMLMSILLTTLGSLALLGYLGVLMMVFLGVTWRMNLNDE